jgi:hypothetical protein
VADFTYEGRPGHEIVLLYEVEFSKNESIKESYPIIESGQEVARAVWRSLQEIREENSKIYPNGIEEFI